MGDKYSIGIDFGTLSARAILINNRTGEEILSSVYGYQDGVIEKYLNSPKIKLPLDYALQNPLAYQQFRPQSIGHYFHRSGFYSLYSNGGRRKDDSSLREL